MKKYNTEEERLEAIRLQKRKYYDINKKLVIERAMKHYTEHKEETKDKTKVYKEKYYKENKEILKTKRIDKKPIANERAKIYYTENKILVNSNAKIYREANKDKIKKVKQTNYNKNKDKIKKTHASYYKKNKAKMLNKNNNYQKLRRAIDPVYKLRGRFRNILYKILKQKSFIKFNKSSVILGCSYEEFKLHLENKFEPWMNWDNYGLYNGELGYGWDIDHIEPISNTKTKADVIRLNHYTNLQPLCSKVNRDIKRDNYKIV